MAVKRNQLRKAKSVAHLIENLTQQNKELLRMIKPDIRKKYYKFAEEFQTLLPMIPGAAQGLPGNMSYIRGMMMSTTIYGHI